MASMARATSLRRSPTSSDRLRLCFTSVILPGRSASVKFLLRRGPSLFQAKIAKVWNRG